jgi:hypothetical protein
MAKSIEKRTIKKLPFISMQVVNMYANITILWNMITSYNVSSHTMIKAQQDMEKKVNIYYDYN